MANELPQYQATATAGSLVKQSTKGLNSGARQVWEAAYGPVPNGYDVDHIIQLQFGGANQLSNLQLKPSLLNRWEGSAAYHLNSWAPNGTVFTGVTIAP